MKKLRSRRRFRVINCLKHALKGSDAGTYATALAVPDPANARRQ